MITKHAPILESCNRVFDSCASTSVPPPVRVANDRATSKSRREQLRDATVSTIGEHPTVMATQRLDLGVTIVDDVVAISGAATGNPEDAEVASSYQNLHVARPAVVLGFSGRGMVAGRDQRPVDDPGRAPIDVHRE